MRRPVLVSILVLLAVLSADGALYALGPGGTAKKARVTVETSRKESLMDLVQQSFERDGYRLHKRTTVDIVMTRKLSGYMERELWRIAGYYFGRDDGPFFRLRDPAERLYLSVVRQTTRTAQIEGYRLLCANPDTASEVSVMDDSPGRADDLLRSLERIKNEMESAQSDNDTGI